MPRGTSKPSVSVASAVVAHNDRDKMVPVTVHVTYDEEYLLRRASETGAIPGTQSEFCRDAIREHLLKLSSGVLASDPEYQLGMFNMKRAREDEVLMHNMGAMAEASARTGCRIGFYANLKNRDAMYEFVCHRWTDTVAIPIPLWREANQSLFQRDSLFLLCRGLKRMGFKLPADLVTYLGL